MNSCPTNEEITCNYPTNEEAARTFLKGYILLSYLCIGAGLLTNSIKEITPSCHYVTESLISVKEDLLEDLIEEKLREEYDFLDDLIDDLKTDFPEIVSDLESVD